LQSVEKQGFFSHCKATAKHQTVENQAFAKILFGFSVLLPKPAYPTHPTLGTIFARKKPSISIHFSITEKLKNKKQKTKKNIERVALESFSVFFSVAFQLFFSFRGCSKNNALEVGER